MKKNSLTLVFLILTNLIFGQTTTSLKMVSNYASDNPEIYDILEFEGIDYYKIKFIGDSLKDKRYQLSVKEIWDGKVVSDSIIVSSRNFPFKEIQTINDSILSITVVAKPTGDEKLKMSFKFPRLLIERTFKALNSKEYRLRNIVEESKLEIGYDKSFYFLAYILPYEKENGMKSWCEVGVNGIDIENWGEKFGIKHYLVFEMKFE